MRSRFVQKGFLCLLLSSAALRAGAQASPSVIRNHFESDAPMRAPAFFDFVEVVAPGASDWMVMSDSNPPSAPNIAVQTVSDRPAESIAVAIRRNVSFRDGRLSIALKRAHGRGGILFRMASEKDFLVLLVDCASGDAQLVAYRAGKPTKLASGQAVFAVDWGVLAIETSGTDVKATFAEKPLLSAKDPAPAAGRAGMATAGPGNVAFDEFVLKPLDSAGGGR
jgi:hypothetical protein